jgi:hypothetical protein
MSRTQNEVLIPRIIPMLVDTERVTHDEGLLAYLVSEFIGLGARKIHILSSDRGPIGDFSPEYNRLPYPVRLRVALVAASKYEGQANRFLQPIFDQFRVRIVENSGVVGHLIEGVDRLDDGALKYAHSAVSLFKIAQFLAASDVQATTYMDVAAMRSSVELLLPQARSTESILRLSVLKAILRGYRTTKMATIVARTPEVQPQVRLFRDLVIEDSFREYSKGVRDLGSATRVGPVLARIGMSVRQIVRDPTYKAVLQLAARPIALWTRSHIGLDLGAAANLFERVFAGDYVPPLTNLQKPAQKALANFRRGQ